MKTLKITLVATIAATLAWKVGIPRQIWPAHPQLANFLLALITCVILQIAWPESKNESSDHS